MRKIGKIQLTYILKRVVKSSFIFHNLLIIYFGLILSSKSEFLLIYKKTALNFILYAFNMDDIILVLNTYQKQFSFLHNFFLSSIGTKLKLILLKLKITIAKIIALKKSMG